VDREPIPPRPSSGRASPPYSSAHFSLSVLMQAFPVSRESPSSVPLRGRIAVKRILKIHFFSLLSPPSSGECCSNLQPQITSTALLFRRLCDQLVSYLPRSLFPLVSGSFCYLARFFLVCVRAFYSSSSFPSSDDLPRETPGPISLVIFF